MDLMTPIGMFLGMTAVVVTCWMTGYGPGYISVPSVILVVGCSLMAVAVSQPLRRIFSSMGSSGWKTMFPTEINRTELVATLVEFAMVARRDGILALENHVDEESTDRFMITGIRMAVDGTDPDLIERLLLSEIATLEDRHKKGRSTFELLGKYCPAWGMIGTLIGLVAMLGQMDDPSAIGPNMAIALLTTMYGAILANLIFLPLADKLAFYSKEEVQANLLVLQGVMAIQSGDNPRIVEQKLSVFLPPVERNPEV